MECFFGKIEISLNLMSNKTKNGPRPQAEGDYYCYKLYRL